MPFKSNCHASDLIPQCRYLVTYTLGEYRGSKQVQITSATVESPMSMLEVVSYLSSIGTGIGRTTASAIWAQYGPDSFKVICEDPERVAAEVKNVTVAKALSVSLILNNSLELNRTKASLNSLMNGFGFQKSAYETAIERLGVNAASEIRRNPFWLLINRIRSCSFSRAG